MVSGERSHAAVPRGSGAGRRAGPSGLDASTGELGYGDPLQKVNGRPGISAAGALHLETDSSGVLGALVLDRRFPPMQYAPRTIALVTELIHPPVQPDPARVQRVHNFLFESGGSPYQSFAVTPLGAVLSNPVSRPGAASTAAFLADRFQFREEHTGLTVEEFAARVRRVSELIVQHGPIQVFTAQQVLLRTLVNPRNFKDSRAFLKQGMFRFDQQTEDFGREPELLGIRLVFPATEEHSQAHALRIESFHNDPRSLYLEEQATFAPILVNAGLVNSGLEAVEANLHEAYAFLVERALRFVGRFDVRQEA
jgi:hypothetical protein